MQGLFIDRGGEVRLGSEIVGTIHWAGPCAHYDVAGEWDQDGGTCCWGCGGLVASQDDYEDIECERDELNAEKERLEKVLKGAVEEIDKLKAEVAALRDGHPALGADADEVVPRLRALHRSEAAIGDVGTDTDG